LLENAKRIRTQVQPEDRAELERLRERGRMAKTGLHWDKVTGGLTPEAL
jgi:hypothetical protein